MIGRAYVVFCGNLKDNTLWASFVQYKFITRRKASWSDRAYYNGYRLYGLKATDFLPKAISKELLRTFTSYYTRLVCTKVACIHVWVYFEKLSDHVIEQFNTTSPTIQQIKL